jgi:hypothetical protein
VSALVWGARRYGAIPFSLERKTDTDLGRLLWRENMRSLAARYGDEEKDLAEYCYQRPDRDFTLAELLKLAHCYEYQSCEHDEWKESDALAFCRSLREALESKVPGYDAAPWGIP